MKAYVIVQETVNDAVTFDAYRKDVSATLADFGGTFIVRGGDISVIEGTWAHQRTVVIEFPSRADAEGWYRSASYQKILPLRLRSAVGNFVIVDGCA